MNSELTGQLRPDFVRTIEVKDKSTTHGLPAMTIAQAIVVHSI
jgi:hypothetical protein